MNKCRLDFLEQDNMLDIISNLSLDDTIKIYNMKTQKYIFYNRMLLDRYQKMYNLPHCDTFDQLVVAYDAAYVTERSIEVHPDGIITHAYLGHYDIVVSRLDESNAERIMKGAIIGGKYDILNHVLRIYPKLRKKVGYSNLPEMEGMGADTVILLHYDGDSIISPGPVTLNCNISYRKCSLEKRFSTMCASDTSLKIYNGEYVPLEDVRYINIDDVIYHSFLSYNIPTLSTATASREAFHSYEMVVVPLPNVEYIKNMKIGRSFNQVVDMLDQSVLEYKQMAKVIPNDKIRMHVGDVIRNYDITVKMLSDH